MRYFLNKEKVEKYYLRYQPSIFLFLKLNQGEKESNKPDSGYYDLTWMEEFHGMEFFKSKKNEYRSKTGSIVFRDGRKSWFDIKEEE